jgi:hypothetical protein
MPLNPSLNTHNHYYTLTILERQHQVVEFKVIEYNKAEKCGEKEERCSRKVSPAS